MGVTSLVETGTAAVGGGGAGGEAGVELGLGDATSGGKVGSEGGGGFLEPRRDRGGAGIGEWEGGVGCVYYFFTHGFPFRGVGGGLILLVAVGG